MFSKWFLSKLVPPRFQLRFSVKVTRSSLDPTTALEARDELKVLPRMKRGKNQDQHRKTRHTRNTVSAYVECCLKIKVLRGSDACVGGVLVGLSQHTRSANGALVFSPLQRTNVYDQYL
ncbi:hypothetical protein J6590_024243 [Homalodisca vitripennis]|nr:hypothetical protein J6590_024243 [Homalodisca vitripennis]